MRPKAIIFVPMKIGIQSLFISSCHSHLLVVIPAKAGIQRFLFVILV